MDVVSLRSNKPVGMGKELERDGLIDLQLVG